MKRVARFVTSQVKSFQFFRGFHSDGVINSIGMFEPEMSCESAEGESEKCIIESGVFSDYLTNSYVLYGNEVSDVILIDVPTSCFSFYENYEPLMGKNLHIFLTHGHFDHCGDLMKFQNAWGDVDLLENEDDTTDATTPKVISYMHKSDMELYVNAVSQNYGEAYVDLCHVDQHFEDGDEITIGSKKIQILHTPGHTRGSTSIYIPDEECVFVGDTLFLGSVGRTDFEYSSWDDMVHSIKTKLYTLPLETVIFTGHGPRSKIKAERKTNYFVRAETDGNFEVIS